MTTQPRRMRIVVTGSASHLAQALLPILCEHPQVQQVIGLDLRPSGFSHPCFEQHLADIRTPRIATAMEGADALVHLAFVVLRGAIKRVPQHREVMRDINVSGSANVFQLARRAGIPRVVHLSSAAVYGAWPDNPEVVTENQPLRPIPGFAYAEDKTAVESWLEDYAREPGAPRVVRLRPHVILGPRCQPLLRFLLRQPFYARLPDPQPQVQCVHEEDVAAAILRALVGPAWGKFNVAADPPFTFRDLKRLGHRRSMALPPGLIRALYRFVWWLSGLGGEPGWLPGLSRSLVLDCTRARQLLGWQPHHSTWNCLAQLS
jgi:UDP-glucose 4-epimerase